MAMLNKWNVMKAGHDASLRSGTSVGSRLKGEKRPYLSSLVSNVAEAEYWRKDIIREITTGVSKIQNEGLPEEEVRELNDRINKLLREKYHWNKRIKELGGADHFKIEKEAERRSAAEESERGNVLMGGGGYKYFGRARELPGVKELFLR